MKQRIGIIGENSIVYVRNLLDIWNEENCAVLIDWRIPAKTAIGMLQEAGVNHCHVDEAFIQAFISENTDIVFIPMPCTESVEPLPQTIKEIYQMRLCQNEALILYSSGTTGKAKGIILSHFAITVNAQAILDYMDVDTNTVLLIVKSMSHSSTIVGELLTGLIGGFNLIISRTFVAPSLTLSNIELFKVTLMCVNPTLLQLYIDSVAKRKYCFKSLNKIYTSGAIAGELLLKNSRDIFPCDVLNIYGLTEAGPRVTAQKKNDPLKTVGRPIKGVNIKVLSPEGQILDFYKKGEIHVKTPSLFSGYVSIPTHCKLTADGWLNTSDMGYMDESGFLYIIGRTDNMIITSAHNVYPEEIEEIICTIPEVLECIVYGIFHPIKGTILACKYISNSDEIDNKYIKKYLSDRLAPYEIPVEFYPCNKLQKTTSGKILRNIYEYFDKDEQNQ